MTDSKETIYTISTDHGKFGISSNLGSITSIRFHNEMAAIRAIKLVKKGVNSNDINDNGVYHKDFE